MIPMTQIPDSFIKWLHEQVKNSHYSQSEASRQAGLNQNAISDIVNGKTREISLHLAKGLGRVFKTPTEDVLRLSGGLPPLPQATKEEREVLAVLRDLPPEVRTIIVQMIRSLKGTSALLKVAAPPAIMTSDPPPPTLPTLDEEIERFLADFPEQAEIIEEARAYKLSEVAIRALIYNVRLVITDPTERMSFEKFQRRLSQMFEEITRAA